MVEEPGLFAVMLCCNDPDTGNFAGRLEAIDVADNLRLESKRHDWSPRLRLIVKDGRYTALSVSNRHFPIRDYQQHVGNWCWNRARMDGAAVLDMLNWLKVRGWYSCDEAEESLYDRWHTSWHSDDGRFTDEDLKTLETPAW